MIFILSTIICGTKDTTINQFKNYFFEEIKHFLKYIFFKSAFADILTLDIKSQKNQSTAVTTQHFRFLHAHVAISNRSVPCEYENEVSILANIRCSFSLRLLDKQSQGQFYFVRYEGGRPRQSRME